MVTKSFNSNEFQKKEMDIGYDYSIGYPYRIYLTFLATGGETEPGDFEFTVRYVKFVPGVSAEEDAGGNVIIIGKLTQIRLTKMCRAKLVGVRRIRGHRHRLCDCASAYSVPHGRFDYFENQRPKDEQGAQVERKIIRNRRCWHRTWQ
jgi:hypothetical protein